MTTETANHVELRCQVAGTELYLLTGGTGYPMLVLHGVEGHEGWLPFHDALAAHATVYAPAHPGFAQTTCPPWLETIQHQAVFYHWYIDQAQLGPVDLVGVGIGGWIAAQMAVICPHNLRNLVLVDAAGIRPEQSDILDIFILHWKEVIERSFYDPETCPEYLRLYGDEYQEFGGPREAGRTMSMRLCFRPFMYDLAFPGLLGKIQSPTLILWGAEDQIIPLECGHLYQQAIPGATLRTLDRAGHWPHYERPTELVEIISEFVAHG